MIIRCWREQLQPQLEEQRLRFHTIPTSEASGITFQFLMKSVYPVLTPLRSTWLTIPQLLNKSLNVIGELEGDDLIPISLSCRCPDPSESRAG
jgi:hypothetical protein